MAQTTVTSPYADYAFYRDTFHGVEISEDDFTRLEARAEDMLDALTFYRIPTMAESLMTDLLAMQIRKAVCAMAEVQQAGEDMGVGVASESNDGYSVSYSGGVKYELQSKTYETAAKYLRDSGLLYRGGGSWYEDR